jgi:indolepyruvate ferredoxin oxidoreductase
MSRYSGCWVGFKTVAETMDSSASVTLHPDRVRIVLPEDFAMPPGGLSIRWPDTPLDQEMRLHRYKLDAVRAFARANRLDRIVIDSTKPRFGIVTTGKSYLDVRQALDDLGIDEREAEAIGLRVYKVAMAWPLEPHGVREFAEGLEEVLVVEEKRAVIETQLKEQLYNWPASARPRIIGKYDEAGEWILPSPGELSPAQIARVIAKRIARFHSSPRIAERLARLEAQRGAARAMSCRFCARRISARAARTTPRPRCPRAAARSPASAAIICRSSWTARPRPSARWAARARRGSARRRLSRRRTSSPISATAPIPIPASWRSAPRSPPRST